MDRKKETLRRRTPGGFTLVEMLVVIAILGVLSALVVPGLRGALESGRISVSRANVRQLAQANLAYAADHGGRLAPGQEPSNLVRWHGGRKTRGDRFDPAEGFLAPYLGESGRVGMCPLLPQAVEGAESWEEGTGGYGYNAAYLGGTPGDPYRSIPLVRISRPARTVMFTTAGFAKKEGVQEYPWTEPYQWLDANGHPAGALQPSTHFRAGGRALVGWADGHVSAEESNGVAGPNFYGGDNEAEGMGWFGPEARNGYWNPDAGE